MRRLFARLFCKRRPPARLPDVVDLVGVIAPTPPQLLGELLRRANATHDSERWWS